MTKSEPLDNLSVLFTELCWFVGLRWWAVFLVLIGGIANGLVAGWEAEQIEIVVVGVAILSYNIPIWLVLRTGNSNPASDSKLLGLAWSMILLDLASLTVLVIATDGVFSPLLGLFVLHMIIASLLLHAPKFGPYIVALIAASMLVVGLLSSGLWPTEQNSLLLLTGWIAALFLVVFITNHITINLRKKETEARHQYNLTQGIFNAAVDGIITINESGIITEANPAVVEIFGYNNSDLIGKNVNTLMPEPFQSEHDSYLEKYINTGERKIICIGREVVGLRQDGSEFPLDIAVSEVIEDGRRHYTGIVRDITERKLAEEELRQLNKELKRQQEALIQQEKMAAMGKMAAGVAHEISNPLASMDSLLQLANRKPENNKPETFEVLREQIRRISQIVRQMTDFAHPTETAWETSKLNEVVNKAISMIRFDHRFRGIEIVQKFGDDVGNAYLMPHAMQQVLVNMLINAADALEGCDSPRLEISTSNQNGSYIIELCDNGCGIAEENIHHIFEPFFTTKPVGKGTGLGLSISYSMIRRQKGKCEVESKVGKGTCFRIILPASGVRESN